ncbi:hypothetical protein BW247_05575 [Acidihalobacter ferrooxydans]|uniref:Uracil-DNA glycosylase-like domain-containing protein n=2 Tax=Acidihalobacter ferrooxydans TaxID=1765967 RepID=A0A1P8UL35_9GAMM|nr:hypothetical protein BW247_05575 [Acidihalobacter ferrooxydans]
MLVGYRADHVFNPWNEINCFYQDHGGYLARRERLLQHMDCDAKLILCGEAPGYQGCAWSGVPFTSERLLCERQIPRIDTAARLSSRSRPWSEPSATTVWKTLYRLGLADSTVLWNAFPWHPHKPNIESSNRKPTSAEVAAGVDILSRFASLYPNARIVAVGRVAADAIQRSGLPLAGAVRHPSYGGAPEFAVGLAALMAS